jgi:hypothetical protein
MRSTKFSVAIGAIALAAVATSDVVVAGSQGAGPRAVFAKHDPIGRLPHTKIEKLGTVRVRKSMFDIYYLDFTNPVSLHGMQRIAVIKNGKDFMGSQVCTLGREDGKILIGRDRMTVKSYGHSSVMRFDEKGPRPNRYLCAEQTSWERNI